MKVAYFAHNVEDAAVLKRIALFRMGGAGVSLIGFRRFSDSSSKIMADVVILGQTYDARFAQRMLAVFIALLWPFPLISIIRSSDAIVCRNLEMLFLGYVIRTMALSGIPLNYECLDINRKMLGNSAGAKALRKVENFLLRRCNAVITSSPAFVHNYFEALQGFSGRVCLIENKLLPDIGLVPRTDAPASPPWVIGWFGIIRCRKSLAYLRALTERIPLIQVVIAGRVAQQEFCDFDGDVRASRNMRFTGPYTAADLPELYGSVHFVWAIDYFEEGDNSAWLLPNRLYDSLAFGSVPIALSSVETGRWLIEHHAGLVIDEPMEDLPAMFDGMNATKYTKLRQAGLAVTPDDIIHSTASAKDLISAIQ